MRRAASKVADGSGGYSIAAEPSVALLVVLGTSPRLIGPFDVEAELGIDGEDGSVVTDGGSP